MKTIFKYTASECTHPLAVWLGDRGKWSSLLHIELLLCICKFHGSRNIPVENAAKY